MKSKVYKGIKDKDLKKTSRGEEFNKGAGGIWVFFVRLILLLYQIKIMS